jgi:hypothetical protein
MTSIILSLATFGVVCVLHSTACHLGWSWNRVISFLLLGCPSGILLAMGLWSLAQPRTQILSGLLIYALACELYIFLFTLTLSSVSANLLLALRRQALTVAEIEKLYDSRKMVDQRLARLEALRLLRRTEDRLLPTPAGLKAKARWLSLRKIFRHPNLDEPQK